MNEGKDGDESSGVSSDGAMKIRRANEGKWHGLRSSNGLGYRPKVFRVVQQRRQSLITPLPLALTLFSAADGPG